MPRSYALPAGRHQLVDIVPAHGAAAELEILDHRDESLRQRHTEAERPGLRDRRAEQRAHLGLAPAHDQIAPDARLGLGVLAIVPGDDLHRALPGPQSAAQFTRQPTVRGAPIFSAISSSLRPFWSDTIAPASASRGVRTSSAADVSCDLTASSTRPSS